MIITISGANFSASNIGTLSTWTVSKSIGAGAEHNIPSYVDKNSAFNYEITLKDGYTFGTYSVTMGGQTITPTVTETSITINIPSVTGAIRIEVKTINSSTGEEEGGVNEGENIVINSNTASLIDLCGNDIWKNGQGLEVTSTPAYIYNESDRTNRIAAYFLKLPIGATVSCTSDYLINMTQHTNPTPDSYNENLSGWVTTYEVATDTYLFLHLRNKNNIASTGTPGVVGDDNAYKAVSITMPGASKLSCNKNTIGDYSVYTVTADLSYDAVANNLMTLCGEDVWNNYASIDVNAAGTPIVNDTSRINRIGAYFIKVPAGTTLNCDEKYLMNVTEHSNPTPESYTKVLSGWVSSYTPTADVYAFIHVRTNSSDSATTASPGVVGDTNAHKAITLVNGNNSFVCASDKSGQYPIYTITIA